MLEKLSKLDILKIFIETDLTTS